MARTCCSTRCWLRSALFTYAQLKDDAARLRKSVSMVIWLIVTMAAPIALALFLTAPDLILLVYGDTLAAGGAQLAPAGDRGAAAADMG